MIVAIVFRFMLLHLVYANSIQARMKRWKKAFSLKCVACYILCISTYYDFILIWLFLVIRVFVLNQIKITFRVNTRKKKHLVDVYLCIPLEERKITVPFLCHVVVFRKFPFDFKSLFGVYVSQTIIIPKDTLYSLYRCYYCPSVFLFLSHFDE